MAKQFQSIRTLDLFCGAGGSSIGARQAGATPIGGVDAWPVATSAFVNNFSGVQTYTGDITKLSPKKLASELGPIDLLLASPECTHHSVAKGNKPRSESSKQLAFEVVRFARQFRPRWIVVENVIQMAKWPMYNDWIKSIGKLGYFIEQFVLNAFDFGVPQSRRRLFVVCDNQTIPSAPRTYRRETATVDWILETAKEDQWSRRFTPLDNGHRSKRTLERAKRAIKELGSEAEFVMVYYGSDGAGGFQTLDRPLRTVTTLDRFAVVRPNCVGHEMRMFQPSELGLAMGFPKNYHFPKSATRRDCIKLMGNAVCPPVMRAIVRTLTRG